MPNKILVFSFLLAASVPFLAAQDGARTKLPQQGSQPLFQYQVVSRTTKAINYGHHKRPVKLEFQGTELLPEARGEARVENRRGAVQIQARFEDVEAPQRFGLGYLTYVVWAISPEGQSQNLGELILDPGDKGKLDASTPMQAFALIVTAEPYHSVSLPSNVVVMENIVQPDADVKFESVNAAYELLPRRDDFVYERGKPVEEGPAVSMSEYEATLALYQAQNAIQHAIVAGADRVANDELSRAQELYKQAQVQSPDRRSSKEVVAMARQAAQTAEAARLIAIQRSSKP